MGDADPVRCARRSLAARLSLAVVFGRDGGGHRTRPVAGIPEARPAARGAERQRRSDDRRRDHTRALFLFFVIIAFLTVTSGVNFTQNQRFEFPYDVVSASSPNPVEDATVLGPIKAKPCGWPRRRGQP